MLNKFPSYPAKAAAEDLKKSSDSSNKKPSKFTQHRINKHSTNQTKASLQDLNNQNEHENENSSCSTSSPSGTFLSTKLFSTNRFFSKIKTPTKQQKRFQSPPTKSEEKETNQQNVNNDNEQLYSKNFNRNTFKNSFNNKSENSIKTQRINFYKEDEDFESLAANDEVKRSSSASSSVSLPGKEAEKSSKIIESGITKDCYKSTAAMSSSSRRNSFTCPQSPQTPSSSSSSIASSSNALLQSTTTTSTTTTSVAALTPEPNPSLDETDHVQNRFYRGSINNSQQRSHPKDNNNDDIHSHSHLHSNHPHHYNLSSPQNQMSSFNDGCSSGLSSTLSSPAPSTLSSPLSSPTRMPEQLHHIHQHCCHKVHTSSLQTPTQTQTHPHSQTQTQSHSNQHHHHHTPSNSQNHPSSPAASSSSAASLSPNTGSTAAPAGCKKWQKYDPRLGPSPYRQLLPIALCILSFATVFATLIVYMDTTEIRHQQFRLNMSRDYDLSGVAQDNPTLIAFLRQIHMRKYPMHFLKNRDTTQGSSSSLSSSSSSSGSGSSSSSSSNNVVDQHLNFSAHHNELTPTMAYYVSHLVGNKPNGAVIQSMTGSVGQLLTAPWLSETLNWMGVIVEPEPRRYFNLRKQNADRPKMQIVHACVSPQPYPKEVTIHYENADVRINSLHDQETSCFNSRVKCFPLYAIMLACDRVEYDLLSLGVRGHELEILKTLPFDKIKIEVISIHLPDDHSDIQEYTSEITRFLTSKNYTLQKKFGRNYFYQRINFSTIRTRKKDIFLLKTP